MVKLVQDANREKGLSWRTYNRLAVHVRITRTVPEIRSVPGTGEVERTGNTAKVTFDACYIVPWSGGEEKYLDFLLKEGDLTYEIVSVFGVDGEFVEQKYK